MDGFVGRGILRRKDGRHHADGFLLSRSLGWRRCSSASGMRASVAGSAATIASGGAPHPACRKLRPAARPGPGSDYAAGEKLPRLSPRSFPASASVVEIENLGRKEPLVPRGCPSGASLCNRAGARWRSGATFRWNEVSAGHRAHASARRSVSGGRLFCLRERAAELGRRSGRPGIYRPSGSFRRVGVRIGHRILRRFFDGFVERRLFGPRFLVLHHCMSLHPGLRLARASKRKETCAPRPRKANAYYWALPAKILRSIRHIASRSAPANLRCGAERPFGLLADAAAQSAWLSAKSPKLRSGQRRGNAQAKVGAEIGTFPAFRPNGFRHSGT